MSQCNYCDRTYETDEALVEHIHQFHDREELSAVDRRWVERYAEATGESEAEGGPSSEGSEDGTFDRRQVMALAGASTLGIAGMTVGLAEQNGLSVGDLPGLGTQNNPIQISTFSELLAIDNDLTADYVLVDDIDASNENPITPFGSMLEMRIGYSLRRTVIFSTGNVTAGCASSWSPTTMLSVTKLRKRLPKSSDLPVIRVT